MCFWCFLGETSICDDECVFSICAILCFRFCVFILCCRHFAWFVFSTSMYFTCVSDLVCGFGFGFLSHAFCFRFHVSNFLVPCLFAIWVLELDFGLLFSALLLSALAISTCPSHVSWFYGGVLRALCVARLQSIAIVDSSWSGGWSAMGWTNVYQYVTIELRVTVEPSTRSPLDR